VGCVGRLATLGNFLAEDLTMFPGAKERLSPVPLELKLGMVCALGAWAVNLLGWAIGRVMQDGDAPKRVSGKTPLPALNWENLHIHKCSSVHHAAAAPVLTIASRDVLFSLDFPISPWFPA